MIRKPNIAITMGDPAGIGAEIIVKTLSKPDIYEICRPVVIGDLDCISDAIRMVDSGIKPHYIECLENAEFRRETIDIIDMDNINFQEVKYGKVSAEAGHAAYEYIERGIELALEGHVDAVVTGPIHKKALNLGGYPYSGHTEIFAKLTHTKDYAMMLTDGDFRVVHVSTHVSLRQACDLVKKERVATVIRLTDSALKQLAIQNPRIAVAGLNPHSGENGLFGREEIDEIIPAISIVQSEGINVDGPVPPDSIFAKVRGGQYDACVAMYHDQGHIPMKTVSFKLDSLTGKWLAVSGVNVTLGLPIIRTSVDHGTAFGKAGKGHANPESMNQAIRMAIQLAIGKQLL